MNVLRLFEPKCSSSTAFNHSNTSGPRIYNKLITKRPEIINFNYVKFKNITK